MIQILKITPIKVGRLRGICNIDLDGIELKQCCWFTRADKSQYLRLSNTYDPITRKIKQIVRPRTKLRNEQIQSDWHAALLEWKKDHKLYNSINRLQEQISTISQQCMYCQ